MIDATKKYTYNGREFRVYATDGSLANGGNPVSPFPIHGAFKTERGEWISIAVSESALIEVKAKRSVWLNAYGNGDVVFHETKEMADMYAVGCNRIACVKVTFREGDGLA